MKELTADEFDTLQSGLQQFMRSDMNQKVILLLLQDQLSEYHSILEDVIAFKGRCQRLELEQEKKRKIFCHIVVRDRYEDNAVGERACMAARLQY